MVNWRAIGDKRLALYREYGWEAALWMPREGIAATSVSHQGGGAVASSRPRRVRRGPSPHRARAGAKVSSTPTLCLAPTRSGRENDEVLERRP
jgi:hypothetical protein